MTCFNLHAEIQMEICERRRIMAARAFLPVGRAAAAVCVSRQRREFKFSLMNGRPVCRGNGSFASRDETAAATAALCRAIIKRANNTVVELTHSRSLTRL
jgi:hypothetical protein